MMEIWKIIDGTNNRQEISNLGRVRFDGIIQNYKEQQTGYLYVKVNLIFGSRWFSIHKLVAAYFLKNDEPELKNQINHIDGNKKNNCADNLEWCTPKENINHRMNILKKDMKGKNNPMYGKSGVNSPAFKGYILRIDVETGKVVGRYESSGEACKKFGGIASNIIRVLDKDRTYHGYKWIREKQVDSKPRELLETP